MFVSRNNEANNDAELRGLFLTELGPRRVEGRTKNFLPGNSLFVVNPQLMWVRQEIVAHLQSDSGGRGTGLG